MALMLQISQNYFPLFTSLLLLLVLVIFWKRSTSRSKLGSGPIHKSPPGPWKLPIIGNLHQLAAAGIALPHHSLRDLAKKYGPIMHLQLGQLEAIVLSSQKAAQEVLKTHDLAFAQRPLVLAADVMSFGQASIVFAPYGDMWRELRKVCVFELLSAKPVQSFRSIREEEVCNLIESIKLYSSSSSQPINLSEKVFTLTNGIVSRAAFGKTCKDQKEFTLLLNETIKLAGGFDIPDLFPSLRFIGYLTGTIPAMKKMQNKLGNILDSIINDHKMKASSSSSSSSNLVFTTGSHDKPAAAHHDQEEDLVDVLLRLQESNKLEFNFKTNQIKDVIMDMFSAGSETSASVMEWAMSELMRNPSAMKKAQAEVRQVLKGKSKIQETELEKLHYLKAVVKETLRLHPPTPLFPREARERCEISGFEIPMKTKVIINEWAVGRDPEIWVDAESFKPERFQGCSMEVFKGFFTFGAGRRICPGISFATAVIELALSQLLYHFDWELGNGIQPHQLDMTETFGISSRRKNDLYVIATHSIIS